MRAAPDRGMARRVRFWMRVCLGAATLCAAGCEATYPEVAIVNRTAEHILLKQVSFRGCVWEEVLAFGEATPPGACLPGRDRIHFQKLDVDADEVESAPNWFNYQTVSEKGVGCGGTHLFEIHLDDMEQDFSVPGPYGH